MSRALAVPPGPGPSGRVDGRIHGIEVHNFKSYKGSHFIGPFHRFQCIIGPNGSGKSNLMDAISFGLGVASKNLRGTNFQDLIHRDESETIEDIVNEQRHGQVTVIFEFDGKQTKCSREIAPDGKCSCKINGRTVLKKDFEQFLESKNILVRARNFLVFQGDVESIGQKNEMELTAMLEDISGSSALKADCIALRQQCDECSTKSRLHAHKTKLIQQEKGDLQKRQAKVDRYLTAKAKISDKRTKILAVDYYKCELVKDQLIEKKEELDRQKDAVSAQLNKCRNERSEADNLKRDTLNGLDVNKEALEKAENAKNQHLEDEAKCVRTMERLRDEVKSSKKERDGIHNKLQKIKDGDVEIELAEAEKNLENKQGALEEAMAKYPELTDAQSKELLKLTRKDTTQNQAIASDKLTKEKHIDHLNRQLRTKTAALDTSKKRLDEKRKDLSDNIETMEWTKKSASANEALLESSIDKLDAAAKDWQSVSSADEELNKKIQDVIRKVERIETNQSMSNEDLKREKFIDACKQRFPGKVYGTCRELISITDDRYSECLGPALGMFNEYLIIDSRDNGEEKEIFRMARQDKQRVSVLALRNLRAKNRNDRLFNWLARRRDTYTLMTDIIKFDSPHVVDKELSDNLIATIMADVVVTENIEKARELAYESGLQVKVVTMDGNVIRKDGNITTGAGRQRGGGFSPSDLNKLRDRVAALRGEQQELNSANIKRALDDERDKVSRCKNEIESGQSALLKHEQMQGGLETDIAELEESIKKTSKDLKASGKELDAQRGELDELEKAHGIQSKDIYQALSSALGVGNIRTELDKKDRESNAMEQDMKHIRKLIKQYQRKLDQFGKDRSKMETDLKSLDQKASSARKALRESETQHNKLNASGPELETPIKDLREEQSKLKHNLKGIEALVKESKEEWEKIRSDAHLVKETLKANKMLFQQQDDEMLTILNKVYRGTSGTTPLALHTGAVDESGAKISRSAEDVIAYLNHVERLADSQGTPTEDDPMDGEQEIPLLDTEEQFKGSRWDEIRIRVKDAVELGEYEEMCVDIKSGLESEANSDEKKNEETKPADLKIKEKLVKVTKVYNDLVIETKKARKEEEEANTQRRAVEKKRKELFLKALVHVQRAVAEIYKDFTRVDSSTGGLLDVTDLHGEAHVELQNPNSDTPYDGGLCYTVKPYLKRWRDGGMAELSGGEKTMAAMALLFALQSLRPAPFVVLDEVDAALDAKNVDALAAYIERASYQCVVISLKERLFRRADALVGVCKPPSIRSSQVLTLLLRREDGSGSVDTSDRSSVISMPTSTGSDTAENRLLSDKQLSLPGPARGKIV